MRDVHRAGTSIMPLALHFNLLASAADDYVAALFEQNIWLDLVAFAKR